MIPKTKNGFGFFQASSAFQKSIRRGDENTALYFTVELFNSGYDEYLWKRIKIITSEDVGLAYPNLPGVIHGLYSFFTDQKKDKKENRPERLFLIHAVTILCRCPKSRLIDWQCIKLWREHDTNPMPVPDYANDMHSLEGKRMGRGLDHFYSEGTKLENHKPQPNEAEIRERAYELHKQQPGKIKFESGAGNKLTQSIMDFE